MKYFLVLLISVQSIGRIEAASIWLKSFLKQQEGLKLTVYADTKKYKAIGYGHRIAVDGIVSCTVKQADKWLDKDIAHIQSYVQTSVKVPLKHYEEDALISFAFNIGPIGFKNSSVLYHINKNQFDKAMIDLLTYVKSDGIIKRGLVIRRQLEVKRFLGEI